MSGYHEVKVPMKVRDSYVVVSVSVDGGVADSVTEDQLLGICEEEIDFSMLSWRLKHAMDDTTEDTSDDETGIRSGKGSGWFSRVFL